MVTRFFSLLVLSLCGFILRPACSGDMMMDADKMAVFISGQATAVDSTSVTVLGLKITLPSAGAQTSRDDESQPRCCGNDGGTTPPTVLPGNWVRIQLNSDAVPLAAHSIDLIGGYDVSSQIHARVQAVDAATKTLTVLGVNVDASGATIAGNSSDNAQTAPLTLADVAAGQVVVVRLCPLKLPALVAINLTVMNAMTKVNFNCADKSGQNMPALGGEMMVEVMQTVRVPDPVSGRTYRRRIVVQTTTQSGAFSLLGLFPGKAKVVYALNGKKHAASVTIPSDGTAIAILKLKK